MDCANASPRYVENALEFREKALGEIEEAAAWGASAANTPTW